MTDLRKQLYRIIEKGYADDVPTGRILDEILDLTTEAEKRAKLEELTVKLGKLHLKSIYNPSCQGCYQHTELITVAIKEAQDQLNALGKRDE